MTGPCQLAAPTASAERVINAYLLGDDIAIYASDGRRVGSIPVLEPPTDLTLGRATGTTSVIPALTSVYALETTVGGQ